MKKYKFTGEIKERNGVILREIQRISDGLIGGWLESEDNLSHEDGCFVYENACVFGNALVYGNAWVYGNAEVYGNARVSGYARIYGNAIVKESWHIKYGRHDKLETVADLVRAQTGLAACNGFVLAYKRVNPDLSSEYDRKFKYKVGKIVKVKEFDPTNKSDASGLHFSTAEYYPREKDKVTLACWIKLEDIITVQAGKIRAKRCKVIGICD